MLFIPPLIRREYFSRSNELDCTLPPSPTLNASLMPSSLHSFCSELSEEDFLFASVLSRSPPFAKIFGRIFCNSRQMLRSGSFFLCAVMTTPSTAENDSRISLRSRSFMKTYPFFAASQLSLLRITTSLSPSFFAALNSRTCPICRGSNPPDTATIFHFRFALMLS